LDFRHPESNHKFQLKRRSSSAKPFKKLPSLDAKDNEIEQLEYKIVKLLQAPSYVLPLRVHSYDVAHN
jgi:hypothetical protein